MLCILFMLCLSERIKTVEVGQVQGRGRDHDEEKGRWWGSGGRCMVRNGEGGAW